MVDVAKESLPFVNRNAPRNYTICRDGDVAFADASEDTNDVAKAIEFVNCNDENVICGLHSIHGRDKTNSTVIGFKGYAFASFPFHKQIRRIAQGTKIYSVNNKNFNEIYIGIPSINEQTKIARLLFLIDERIATQNKIIEDLKKLKSAIIDKVFCNPEECVPQMRFVGYNQDWQNMSLSDICQRIRNKNTDNKCQLVLTIAAQYGMVSQKEFFNKSIASEKLDSYYLLRKGDFAYNKSYSADYSWGAIKRLDNYAHGVLSPLYICFRPDSSLVDSDFLVHYFESKKWYKGIMDIAGEGARNHGLLNISVFDYFNTTHRIPCLEEQQEIAKILNGIVQKIVIEQHLRDCLVGQRVYLLQQMFI